MNGICHQGAWPHEIVQGGCTDGGVGVGFLSRSVLVCLNPTVNLIFSNMYKSDYPTDHEQYLHTKANLSQ